MEEVKNQKIKVSHQFIEVYDKISSQLKSRGYNLSHSEFIDDLLSIVSQEKLDDIVDQKTPLEYKIKEALLDPQKRDALEKLVSNKKKSFNKNSELSL